MDIWFYHLTRQPLDKVLPELLERSARRGWKAVVQARSEERVRALDEWLWTFSNDSFLVHGTAADGDFEWQQVYLTTGVENPSGANARFFVESAEIAPALAESSAYERVVLIFDGNDPDELQAARDQWRLLKGQGHALSYWKQTEGGGWEKMAI